MAAFKETVAGLLGVVGSMGSSGCSEKAGKPACRGAERPNLPRRERRGYYRFAKRPVNGPENFALVSIVATDS